MRDNSQYPTVAASGPQHLCTVPTALQDTTAILLIFTRDSCYIWQKRQNKFCKAELIRFNFQLHMAIVRCEVVGAVVYKWSALLRMNIVAGRVVRLPAALLACNLRSCTDPNIIESKYYEIILKPAA